MLYALWMLAGWCGTLWPGWWRGPRPPQPPDPWWWISKVTGVTGGLIGGFFVQRFLIGAEPEMAPAVAATTLSALVAGAIFTEVVTLLAGDRFAGREITRGSSSPQDVIAEADRLVPDIAELRRAADESERRAVLSRPLELLEYQPSNQDRDEVIVPEGTVTIFLARPGSALLREVRAAVEGPDGQDAAVFRKVRAQYEHRRLMPLARAIDLLISQDVFADLQLGRFTLASNLFVPNDLSVAVFSLPYNGGELPSGGLTLLERTRAGTDATFEGFAVRHRPVLTAVEAEALRALPQDAFDLNLGKAAMCYAITGVVLVGAVMGATYACPGRHSPVHLDPHAVARLGPEGSARELLALRRAALERRAR